MEKIPFKTHTHLPGFGPVANYEIVFISYVFISKSKMALKRWLQ